MIHTTPSVFVRLNVLMLCFDPHLSRVRPASLNLCPLLSRTTGVVEGPLRCKRELEIRNYDKGWSSGSVNEKGDGPYGKGVGATVRLRINIPKGLGDPVC